MPKPKILLVADVLGWIFERHCKEIQNRLSNKYQFKITYRGIERSENFYKQFDLIYHLDTLYTRIKGVSLPEKTIMGLRCEFCYKNKDFTDFYDRYVKDKCMIYHVVNKTQYNDFKPIVTDKPFLYVPHGINIDIFNPIKSLIKPANNSINIGIVGNEKSGGNKGFDLVRQACDELNLNLIIPEERLTLEEMPNYYNSIDVYCCMSESEGLNNCILEASAMGKPVITTKCGAAEEIIRNGLNGYVLNERSVTALKEKLMLFQQYPQTIPLMGRKGRNEILKKWSWDILIKGYQEMFDLGLRMTK